MLGSKLYTIGSILLTGFVTLNTYLNHEEFYPTIVYMAKSKAILLVLFNFIIVLSVVVFKIITRVFFSSLKEAEIQNMESRAMHHGFNLVIVLYMLHLEFDWHIASHIAANIYVYSLHSLANKRVEYLFTERYPVYSYFQMGIFHAVLIMIDWVMMNLEDAKNYESLGILLAYEYILMGFFALKSFMIYLLHMYEKIFKDDGWEKKPALLSFVEFFYNFIALGVIVVEFMVLSKRSAIGIYFIDKSLRAIMNMWTYLSGYLESRSLLSKVNNFPDATIEEIHRANDKCIFCLDHLTEAKRINCGHLFHYKCLKSYFENSSSPKCPTCRSNINENVIHHHKTETISQNIASSFLLQELPSHVTPIGSPLEIGTLSWALPQVVSGHKISRHNEKMRHAVENMNEFIVRFYKHPPDQETEENGEKKENVDQYKHLKENFLRMFEGK